MHLFRNLLASIGDKVKATKDDTTIENDKAVAEINYCGGHKPNNLETGEMISSEKIYI